MNTPLRVLMVEDDEDDLQLSLLEMRRGGFNVSWSRVETRSAMEQALAKETWDLILCDHLMPQFSSSMALDVMRAQGKDIPFIIVSGAAPEDIVTAAMRAGAHDFISKGSLVRLVPAIQRELREAAGRRERQQIAGRLAESENRYSDLFIENPAPMLLVDAATLLLVDANPAAAAFFGHALESLKQVTVQALSRAPHEGWMTVRRAKERRSHLFSDQMFLADGRIREVDVYAVRIQQGGRSLLLATLFDQTDRKAAEASEAMLAAAVEQVAEAISITDTDGNIAYANKAFQTLTGFVTSMIKGWAVVDLLERDEIRKALQQAAQGMSWQGQVMIRTEGGKNLEADITCSPLRDSEGVINYLVMVMRDVTKEVELERGLRQSQKMEALGSLAAGIAHDSNNILTTILTAAELAKWKLPPDSPILPKLDVILQAGL